MGKTRCEKNEGELRQITPIFSKVNDIFRQLITPTFWQDGVVDDS